MRSPLKTGLVALLLALAGPAAADVESGWQAFLNGDYDTALDQLEPAADAGDATAQYYLGVLYYDHGEGVLRNYRTATGWYEKAAAQGNSDAQFNLGMIYYNGTGDPGAVPQDQVAAARWLEPAADAGHPMANYFMCQLLDEGKVVERDLSRALTAASPVPSSTPGCCWPNAPTRSPPGARPTPGSCWPSGPTIRARSRTWRP
jgi:tetratricopeptide (TPR) repeat protein